MKSVLRAAAIAASACLTTLALGQTPPDAGSLLRETERGGALPRVPSLPPAPAAPLAPAAKGMTVEVKGFRIVGASLVAEGELQELLADLLGKSLTLAELEQAVQRLAEHYRGRGWFARVYLPEQDIRDGVVTIAVIEGRLGAIELDGGAAVRTDPGFVRELATADLALGEPLPAEALQRGLLLANDLPGIKARGILEAGDKVGETRLRLRVEDGPLVGGSVSATNHGVKSIGTAQINAGLDANNLSGRGDQLGLRALAAQGLDSLRLHYAAPLGSDGLRATLRASELRYELGDAFAALGAKGRAATFGGGLSYPLRRSATRNLAASLDIDRKRYADDLAGAPSRRRDNDVYALAVAGDLVDGLGGGGFTQAGMTLSAGRLDLAGAAADLAADQASARTHGGWHKLSGQLSRLQRLPAEWVLSAALSMQWAGKNLDSSEKFSLGGPNGVRAYPVNEAAGDEGWLANLELRRDLGQGWQVLGFVDAGGVRLHRNEWAGWQGGGSTPNRYELAGIGFGLAWQQPGEWSLRLTVAAPLGSNPGRDAAGRNSDGSGQHSARGWLQLTRLF